MAIPTGNIIIGIKVEGVGKTSAVPTLGADAALWRFTTAEAGSTLDPQGLYKDWLVDGSLPDIEFSTDYRTGNFVIGDAAFRILCKIDDADLDPRSYFLNTSPTSIGQVSADHTASSITVQLTGDAVTGLDGTAIYIGRECILLDGEDLPGSPGLYEDCTRGIHGTVGAAIDVSNPRHVLDVYDVFPPRGRGRRLVTLFYLDLETASSLSDEQVIWRGVIDTCGRPDYTQIQIQCLGLTSLLKDVKLYPNPWTCRVLSLPPITGGPANAYVDFYAEDQYGEETSETPAAMASSPTVGDSTYVWFRDSIFRLIYQDGDGRGRRYYIILGAPLFGTKAVKYEDVRVGDTAHEVLAVGLEHPGTGPTSAVVPLGGTTGDVLEAVKQMLMSTQQGWTGLYDTQIDFGFGIPPDMIDLTTFDAVRYRLGDRLVMPRTFIGAHPPDKPEKGLAKIRDQILIPLQLVFSITSEGKLGIESLRDLEEPGETIVHIDGSSGDVLGLSSTASGDDRVVGKIQATYARKGDGKGRKMKLDATQPQGDVLSPSDRVELDLGGYADFASAWRATLSFLQRWGHPISLIQLETHLSADVPLGALCKLTTEDVLNVSDGVVVDEGVSAVRCHAVKKRIALSGQDWKLVYTLLYTGERLGRLGWIAPAGEVVSWDGGTKALTLEANVFVPTAANGGLYDSDADAFNVGDLLVLLDEDGAVKGTGGEVSGIAGNVLTISPGFSATPAAGDLVVWVDWDTSTSTQQAQAIAIADTDGTLGSGSPADAGFSYEG